MSKGGLGRSEMRGKGEIKRDAYGGEGVEGRIKGWKEKINRCVCGELGEAGGGRYDGVQSNTSHPPTRLSALFSFIIPPLFVLFFLFRSFSHKLPCFSSPRGNVYI